MESNKNILVLTDFSKNSVEAERYAVAIAQKLKVNVILYNSYPIHVTAIADTVVWPHDDLPSLELQSISNLQSSVDEWNERINKLPEGSYRPKVSFLEDPGNLKDNILDVVIKNDIWLVVMGTKGEGHLSTSLFGSNVFKVLDHVDCPVLIVPQNGDPKHLKKIAYATDLATTDINVVEWLQDFCESVKAILSIIHVKQKLADEALNETQKFHDSLLKKFTHVEVQYVNGNSVKDSLHEIAEDFDVDMLALMHRKYNFFETLFHNSISRKLIRHTQIPILVFPG